MILLLMRHGVAAERDATCYPDDDLRPLTARGRRRTRGVARGLATLKPRITQVMTSPLRRAEQTARIVADVLGVGAKKILKSAALAPDRPPRDVLGEWPSSSDRTVVLLVGHEPHLSRLLSLLITGQDDAAHFFFKKAGIACVQCPARPTPGSATLHFFLKPSQIAALAG